MSPRLVIDIKDRATPEVNRLIAGMQPGRVANVIGPRLRECVRNHLKQNPRNRKGWPSTGFWEDAARATNWEAEGATVTIKINKIGVRQRFHGGVIRAVEAKFLTIPISAQAYGHTAADFPGSFIITTKKGAYIVRYGSGFKSRRFSGSSTLEFLFKLKSSVTQKENPNVIPDTTTLTAVAISAVEEHFRKTKAAKAGGS